MYHIGFLENLENPGTLGNDFKPQSKCLWLSFNNKDWLDLNLIEQPERFRSEDYLYEIELSGNFLEQDQLMKYYKPLVQGQRILCFDFDQIRKDGYDGYLITEPTANGLWGYEIPQCCVWNMQVVSIISQRKLNPLTE